MASQSRQPAPGTRRRPQRGVSQLASLSLLAFIALKLAGVINWSWWWVLAPLWIILAQPALAAGFLVALYARQLWLRSRFRRPRIWLPPPTAPPTGEQFAVRFGGPFVATYEPAPSAAGPRKRPSAGPDDLTQPDTRIVLRSPHPGGQNDPIVDHPGQPGPYTAPDGTHWTWQNDQAWRQAGNADLRVYHRAPPT